MVVATIPLRQPSWAARQATAQWPCWYIKTIPDLAAARIPTWPSCQRDVARFPIAVPVPSRPPFTRSNSGTWRPNSRAAEHNRGGQRVPDHWEREFCRCRDCEILTFGLPADAGRKGRRRRNVRYWPVTAVSEKSCAPRSAAGQERRGMAAYTNTLGARPGSLQRNANRRGRQAGRARGELAVLPLLRCQDHLQIIRVPNSISDVFNIKSITCIRLLGSGAELAKSATRVLFRGEPLPPAIAEAPG